MTRTTSTIWSTWCMTMWGAWTKQTDQGQGSTHDPQERMVYEAIERHDTSKGIAHDHLCMILHYISSIVLFILLLDDA